MTTSDHLKKRVRRAARKTKRMLSTAVFSLQRVFVKDSNAWLYDLEPHNLFLDEETQSILRNAREPGRSPGVQMIARAGESLGGSTEWIDRYHAVSTVDGKRMLLSDFRSGESVIGIGFAADKLLSKQLLMNAGVSVPTGRIVSDADEAIAFSREVNVPIVLKPRNAQKARGVSVNLRTSDEIRAAFTSARAIGEVLAEVHISGSEFRGFASPDACHGVIGRVPPWVEGDGKSTIAQLIEEKNETRQFNPSTVNRPIPSDAQTISQLEDQNLSLSSVLVAGRRVVVRGVSSVSVGGEPRESLDTAPEAVREIARAAVAAMPGLPWAGVDIMVAEDGQAYVMEINTNAAIGTAVYPYFGSPRPLNRIILEQRLRHTEALPEFLPLSTALHAKPRPIAEASSIAWADPAPLSSILQLVVTDRGWGFEAIGNGLSRATMPEGEEVLLRGCSTAKDLGVTSIALRRIPLMRKLLAIAGLDGPRFRRIKSRSDLTEFAEELEGDGLVVIPHGAMWGPKVELLMSPGELDARFPRVERRYVAQHYPSGIRFTVFASTTAALAVTSPEVVARDHIEMGSELAVRAVRAVPGLRWAAVGVVVPAEDGGRALIESVSMNPTVSPDEYLLSGDLEAVWKELFDL